MRFSIRFVTAIAILFAITGAGFADDVLFDGAGELGTGDARFEGRLVDWTRIDVNEGDSLSISSTSLAYTPQILVRVGGDVRNLSDSVYGADPYFDEYYGGPGFAGPVVASFIVPERGPVEVGVVAATQDDRGSYLLRVVRDNIEPIGFGETAGEWSMTDSQLPDRGYVDWYRLDPGRQGLVTLEIESDVDSYLIVREGEVERYDDDSGRDSNALLSFVADGSPVVVGVTTYSMGTTGPYQLRATIGEVEELQVGTENRGTIGGDQPSVATYLFSAPRDGEYLLFARADTELELTVAGLDEMRWSRPIGVGASGLLVDVERGQALEVRVSSYDDWEAAFTVGVSAVNVLRELRAGQTYRGRLSDQRGYYTPGILTLRGNPGDLVRIGVDAEGFDAEVFVTDSTGNQSYFSSYDDPSYSSPLAGIFMIPNADPVRIEVWAGYSGGTGSYSIAIEDAGAAFDIRDTYQGYRLRPGDEIVSTISQEDEGEYGNLADTFTISLDQGDNAEVTLMSSMFDSYLEVEGPDGFSMSDDDGAGNLDSLLWFSASVAGDYVVTARSLGGSDTGLYIIRYELGEPESMLLEIDGELGSDDDQEYDSYFDDVPFQGTAGQEVTIRVTSPDFDTVLYLEDPDGNEIDYNDDAGQSTDSMIRTTLPVGGVYRIIVSSYSSYSTGAYRLTVTE